MDEVPAFGRLLLESRRAVGLSQLELARASGMSARALRELERGRTQAAQARSAEVLADALGLTDDQRILFLTIASEGRRRTPRAAHAIALPTTAAVLVGRERELDSLRADAAKGGVVTIDGPAGVGKTALAVAFARQLSPQFPGGCLAVDLLGTGLRPMASRTALEKLLRATGLSTEQLPGAEKEQAQLWLLLLEGKRTLIILDNAVAEEQVGPLLARTRGCLTVITCRNPLTLSGPNRRLHLGPLDGHAAISLLAEIAGTDRVAAEPDAARELAELCGGLPMALRIVGNRLATRPQWTLSHLAQQLSDEQQRSGSLSVGDLRFGFPDHFER